MERGDGGRALCGGHDAVLLLQQEGLIRLLLAALAALGPPINPRKPASASQVCECGALEGRSRAADMWVQREGSERGCALHGTPYTVNAHLPAKAASCVMRALALNPLPPAHDTPVMHAQPGPAMLPLLAQLARGWPARRAPYVGYRSDLVACLANALFGRRAVQDEVFEVRGWKRGKGRGVVWCMYGR